MPQVKVTAPYQDVRLIVVDKISTVAAETSRILPGYFASEAQRQGCKVEDVDGTVLEPVKQETPGRIDAIVNVIKEIMDAGDPALLTNEGYPRVTEVESRLGYDVTAEERTEAWNKYSGE